MMLITQTRLSDSEELLALQKLAYQHNQKILYQKPPYSINFM